MRVTACAAWPGWLRVAGLAVAILAAMPAPAAGPGMPDCEQALQDLRAEAFIGDRARCAGQLDAFCRYLVAPETYERLTARMEADRAGTQTILSACGLDFATLRERLCGRAYSHEDLGFVYAHCPDEAWSLARAQCERTTGSESARYAEFCRAFKSGRAPDMRR